MALGALAAGLLLAGSASAATIQVDSLDDNTASDGLVTLREAIIAANTDAPFGDAPAGSGADIIDLSILTNGTIILNGPLPAIDSDLTILGPEVGSVTVDGVSTHRLFTVLGGNVRFQYIGFVGGFAGGGKGADGYTGGGGAAGAGGGLLVNAGRVELRECYFDSCTAQGGDGGAEAASLQSGGGGGGIGGDGQVPGGPATGGDGGDGGVLGGAPGAGVLQGPGGTGGDGAGGGGGGVSGASGGQPGGVGGFLGGGGGGGAFAANGGTGGFGGGGGGADADGFPGVGGIFGGNAVRVSGGGGAGMGGAIFVRNGGYVDARDLGVYFADATPGAGGVSPGPFVGNRGQGKGGGIFLEPGATMIGSDIFFFGNTASDAASLASFNYNTDLDTADVYGRIGQAEVIVTTLQDEDDGAGLGTGTSLREALGLVATGGTVRFQEGLSGISTLVLGGLTLDRDVEILGPGGGMIAVDANNAARHFTVGFGVTAMIEGLDLWNGLAPGDNGGAVRNDGGTLTLQAVTMLGNSADQGGAVANQGGNLRLVRVVLASNNATSGGGGLHNSNGLVRVEDSSFDGNQVFSGFGAGINNLDGTLVVLGSTISSNSAVSTGSGGGGIHSNAVDGAASLTIINSTVSNNQGESGGGIMNGGALTIANSTISGNRSLVFEGGGLLNYSNGVVVVNSTFSGNSASQTGGGIWNAGTVTITNSTVTGNQTTSGDGGGIFNNGGLLIQNTIVAGNTNGGGTGPDISDSTGVGVSSGGGNVIGNDTGAAGAFNQTNDRTGNSTLPLDPLLGPLADNGGPVETHHPLAGSPAIDNGLDTLVNGANFPTPPFGAGFRDARGAARINGAAVDSGAVEGITSLVVDTNKDVNDGDYSAGNLELREAIGLVAPGGTIKFDAAAFGSSNPIFVNGDFGVFFIAKPVTIEGPGQDVLFIDADGNFVGVFLVEQNVQDVVLSGLTVRNAFDTDGQSGGLHVRSGASVEVSGARFLDCVNTSGEGGAISVGPGADLLLRQTTLMGNLAGGGGGAIVVNSGRLTIDSCTIAENESTGSQGAGGLWVYSNSNSAQVTIVNSTFGENLADQDGAHGGAIATDEFDATVTVDIAHSTFIDNESSSGGAIDIVSGGTVSLTHTIVVNRGWESLWRAGAAGTFVSDGFNLIGTEFGTIPPGILDHEIYRGSPERIVDINLCDNGGPTPTYPVKVHGPAIDGGNPAVAGAPAVDQRGLVRVLGGSIDLGAVEAIRSLIVDNASDIDNASFASGDTTLREAIRYTASGAKITFDAALHTPTPATIGITSELPVHTDKLVTGPGSSLVTLDGGNATRLMAVMSGRLEMSGVDLANGRAQGGRGGDGYNGGGGGAGVGGAVFVASGAVAKFKDCAFEGNEAIGGDGGDALETGSVPNGGGGGGGIGGFGNPGNGESADGNLGGGGGDGTLFGNFGGLGGSGQGGFGPFTGVKAGVRSSSVNGEAGAQGAGGGGGGYDREQGNGGSGGFGGDFGGGGAGSADTASAGGAGGFGGGGGGAQGGDALPGTAGLHGGDGARGAFGGNGGGGGGGGAGLGGAVFFDQDSYGYFENCRFEFNSAAGGIGGISVVGIPTKGTVAAPGSDGEGKGGALYLRDGADVTLGPGNTFVSNSAVNSFGTGYTEGFFDDTTDLYGIAGISNALVTTSDDENDGALGLGVGDSLREAVAGVGFGGTIDVDFAGQGIHNLTAPVTITRDVTVNGTDPFSLSGGGSDRIFLVQGNVAVTLNDIVIEDGASQAGDGDGGGIRNDGATLFLNHVIIQNSQANGGGGALANDGRAVLDTCELTANTSLGGAAGGILNVDGASLELHKSTVAGNSSGVVIDGGLEGGGIVNRPFASTLLVSTTVSGNAGGLEGGGLFNEGKATLTNVTVVENTTSGVGGGIHNAATGSLVLRNTIVADNSAGIAADADIANLGAATSGGGNLVGISDNIGALLAASDQSGGVASPLNPGLAPLGPYGGLVRTHGLMPLSLALDTGDNSYVNAGDMPNGLVDARWTPRIHNGTVDVGAYESGDYDNDGVEDDVEIDTFTRSTLFADGDGDGVNDLAQATVASFRNAVNLGALTFVTDAGAFTSGLPESTPTGQGLDPLDFPIGFYRLAVGGLTPGQAFNIDLLIETDPGQQNAYGFGPTLANGADHLYDFNDNGTVGASYPIFPALDQVSFAMQDGATESDQDLAADGVLNHFGAIGVSAPTIAEVTAFAATTPGLGAPVTVTWETASEVNNLGFHVYRAVPTGSGFVAGERLTSTLIVSQADALGGGASYSFVDSDPLDSPDDVRGYFLVDLDASGKQSRHGPAVVSIKSLPSSVGDWMLLER